MDISNPRRILAVSKSDSGLIELIEALTNSAPTLRDGTVAGITHNWLIKTSYYTANIPIWLDKISQPSVWSKEFLAPEAREVLKALGGFIVAFRKPVDEKELQEVKSLLESVSEVVKEGCGLMWDGACLAVAMPQSITPYLEKSFDEWEELCQAHGFEFIDFESKGRNEYAEPMGIERLKEALEANDWESSNDLDDVLDLDEFDENGLNDGFGIEAAELEMEMFGMKEAIHNNKADAQDDENEDIDDEDIEKLQAMMLKLQAVKGKTPLKPSSRILTCEDTSADMPEAERKRFAAKAVNEIMKSL